MGKTGTKGPTTIITAVISIALVVSAVSMGFRQLLREGVFSETQPVKLTQSPPATPSPSRMQSPPQTPSSPGTPPSRQMPSQGHTPPSAGMQPPVQRLPSLQTQSTEPGAPAPKEAPSDSSEGDRAFEMWFEQEMEASAFEEEMQEMVAEEPNAPQKAPAPAQQTEPNTDR